MNYVLYAVPFFFLLIGIELIVDRLRGTSSYRTADALNSLSAGVLSTTSGLLTKVVGLLTYSVAWQHLALFDMSAGSLWVWLLAFVFYDFCYYWNHRLGHERNVLWAAHSVHHQSEEYNLSTALRQTSTGFLFSWIFYLPMAIAGVPSLVFFSVGALNLLYQFWVHTRHVPKLGWLEWIFITPTNHRVHHAQNPLYLDRNYGGVFIIWDRLFGTFQEEDEREPVIFGVTTPLASWNPLWANVQFYAQLWHDARRTASWWDKLRIWFMPTGWRPADVAAAYPQPKQDLAAFRKFDFSKSVLQEADLKRWFQGVAGAAGRFYQGRVENAPCGGIEGTFRLAAPWPQNAVLKFAPTDCERLQLHLFRGRQGATLVYHRNPDDRWSGYVATRSGGEATWGGMAHYNIEK